MEQSIKDACNELRTVILEVGEKTLSLKSHWAFKAEQSSANQHSEMLANIMLAYRHIEDARMRIGKVIQAYEGGVSCYGR